MATQGNQAMDISASNYYYKKRKSTATPSRAGSKLTKRQKREVKKLIANEAELKYLAFSQIGTTSTSTPSVVGASFDVAQGVGDQQRVGDRLRWCGFIQLKIQAVAGFNSATADVYNNVRFVIFQWHPNSTPAATDVFINGPTGGVDNFSQYNHDKRQMYTILFDKNFKVVSGTNTNASTAVDGHIISGVLSYDIKLKGKKWMAPFESEVQYVGGGATATNRLYTMHVSDSAFATHPTIEWTTKIVFRDS